MKKIDKIKEYLKEENNKVIVTNGCIEVIFPEYYFEKKMANKLGEVIETFGIFNFVIYKDSSKSKKILDGIFDLPSVIRMKPSYISSMDEETLKRALEMEFINKYEIEEDEENKSNKEEEISEESLDTNELLEDEEVKSSDDKYFSMEFVPGDIFFESTLITKEKHNDYLIQTIPYNYNKGWFDVNKSGTGYSDRVLCSGAVASNMIHWWLLQNKKYIDKYLKLHPEKTKLSNDNNVWKNLNYYLDSFSSQNDSKVFDMFKLYYGKTNGIWADTSVDFFINGYKASLSGATNDPEKYERDERGGFFYDVFKTNVLTNRYFSGNYEEFSDAIKTELQNGNIIGLSHRTGSKKANHIITVWGADFNSQGKIIGVYVTDSDDYTESNVAMRRLNVNNKDGKPVITASMKKDIGINLEYIHTLSLGTKYWEEYFK